MMSQKKHAYTYRAVIAGVLASVLLFWVPENVWALQTHGAPEGIFVHQMAHVLFMATLGYLYWHTRKTEYLQGRGWRYLQVFCVLLSLWNGAAFLGHEMLGHLTVTDFMDKGSWHEQLTLPLTPAKAIYFVTRLDHLLFVPALAALVISLRTFYKEANRGGEI